MTYRRRQGLSNSSTFNEETLLQPNHVDTTTNRSKSSASFDNVLKKNANERGAFWSVLARKAKSIVDDKVTKKMSTHVSKKPETVSFSTNSQFIGIQVQCRHENSKKMDNRTLMMELDRHRLKASVNQVGDAIGNALEAAKTQSTIQETHYLQNRRAFDNQENNQGHGLQSSQSQMNQETQLQASRDVALAKAAKVKQLAWELKITTAELAFAKERCCQLEQQNKLLHEVQEKGDHPSDDDIIRVQLEALLAEKGRLAHENSVYARENMHLREIVEFHQVKMQDMVYFDEDIIDTSQDLVEELVASTRFDLESSESTGAGGFAA